MKNKIINKGTGAGGSRTNQNGIKFEESVYLKDWIEKEGYNLKNIEGTNRSNLFEIYDSENLIGYYGRQSKIYTAIMLTTDITKEKINQVLSKTINPDGFILNVIKKELVIFEKKWQQTSGSVDEKIQTAPYKLKMFERLLNGTGFTIRYEYILSSWFANEKYRDTKNYYKDFDRIEVWTETENLSELNINDYLK